MSVEKMALWTPNFSPPPMRSNGSSLIDPLWQNASGSNTDDGSDVCAIDNSSNIAYRNIVTVDTMGIAQYRTPISSFTPLLM